MKSGDKRKKLEEEKGILIRFVIGHRWVLNMIVNMVLAIHLFFFVHFFFISFYELYGISIKKIMKLDSLPYHYLNHGIDLTL